MLVAKESFRNSCASSTMIWSIADLGDGQQVVLAGRERLQPLLVALLHALEPLAREAVVAVDLGQQVLVGFKLVLDHLLLEGGRHRDELEGGMGDDDRVPVRGRGPRQEAVALLLARSCVSSATRMRAFG